MYRLSNNIYAEKRSRKTKAERALEGMVSQFREMQEEEAKKFKEWEEERWSKERETEERWRREDKEHEVRLMQMMMQCQPTPQAPLYPSYDFSPQL